MVSVAELRDPICCVLPVPTYGAESLTLTKAFKNKLKLAQKAIERRILGILHRDKTTNEWIRQQTIVDVMHRTFC